VAHGEDLRQASDDDELVAAVMRDPLKAPLSEADAALVRFAEQLTHRPTEGGPVALDTLRAAGFDDRAIHDAVQVIALFAYYNRIAEALGVKLEDDGATHLPAAQPASP
jgi:uncharacterized peroxidase-related enzyme